MTSKQLALFLCKAEGKKRQVDIANMSEIVKNLGLLIGPASFADKVKFIVLMEKIYLKHTKKKSKR